MISQSQGPYITTEIVETEKIEDLIIKNKSLEETNLRLNLKLRFGLNEINSYKSIITNLKSEVSFAKKQNRILTKDLKQIQGKLIDLVSASQIEESLKNRRPLINMST